MLKIVIKAQELFNEETGEFENLGRDFELELEHSLVSLSKWESKFKKPFLTNSEKSTAEILAYFDAMIISENAPEEALLLLSKDNMVEINDYIQSPESATTFGVLPERKTSGEIITAELIYYWMVAFNIPFECERWHLNRLFALIRICNIKNSKPQPMSKNEIARRNRDLNVQRRKQLNTSG